MLNKKKNSQQLVAAAQTSGQVATDLSIHCGGLAFLNHRNGLDNGFRCAPYINHTSPLGLSVSVISGRFDVFAVLSTK